MRRIAILIAMFALPASQAGAIGCFSGGTMGAIAGHQVHHGVTGAVAGCVAGHYAHKHAKKKAAEQKLVDQQKLQDQQKPADPQKLGNQPTTTGSTGYSNGSSTQGDATEPGTQH